MVIIEVLPNNSKLVGHQAIMLSHMLANTLLTSS
jgi:hypothetical protein